MNSGYQAVANYAAKYRVDAPGVEPTDAALREVLKGCALPPRYEWLPVIRLVLGEREGKITDEDLAFSWQHAAAYARGDQEYGEWYARTYGLTADGLEDLPSHPNAHLRYREWLDTQEDDDDQD